MKLLNDDDMKCKKIYIFVEIWLFISITFFFFYEISTKDLSLVHPPQSHTIEIIERRLNKYCNLKDFLSMHPLRSGMNLNHKI